MPETLGLGVESLSERRLSLLFLRGLISTPFHYVYEARHFVVDLPKPIRGKLRCIGDPFVSGWHLFVSNGRHEGAVKKRTIAHANCVS
jgi:hypothetical protein